MTGGMNRNGRMILVYLYLAYLLSFADRVIFSVALKPIKTQLGLSDSELGLLSGAAFAVSYAVFSPIGGFIADKASRKKILVFAVAFWSAATFYTGMAMSFATMAAARAAVGAGEALLHPLAISLVGDTTPRERRARAFGVYLSAGSAGVIVALLLGGFILHAVEAAGGLRIAGLGLLAPWQVVFVAAALPGFLLALIVMTTMKDAPRTRDGEIEAASDETTSGFMRANPFLLLAIFLGIALFQLSAYTVQTWNVVFFERTHGWTGARTAIALALTSGVMSLVGCLASGRLIEWLRGRGRNDAPLVVCVIGGICFCVFTLAAMAAPTPELALGLIALAAFWGYAPSIGGYVAMGEIIPSRIRARLAGLHILSVGLVSNSLGPFLVGFFSDNLFPQADGVRWALFLTVVCASTAGLAITASGLSNYRRRADRLVCMSAPTSIADVP